jgi:hypothetical protein
LHFSFTPDIVKTEDMQYIKIDKIINHPEFNPAFYYHDLALVRLISDIRLATEQKKNNMNVSLSYIFSASLSTVPDLHVYGEWQILR